MQELRGKTAVITGAASGIGLAMAERFAAEGMRIVLADIEVAALQAARETLAARGAAVLAVPTDVSDAVQVEGLAEKAYERFGAVHLLCNNAGVVRHRRVWEFAVEDWRWVFGVNVFGVIHGIRSFVPRMLAGGEEGHVVNTASSQALRHGNGAYGTSKHAVAALSEALYTDLKAVGAPIGVTVICPGPIKTNIGNAWRNHPPHLSEEQTEFEARQTEWAKDLVATQGRPPAELASLVAGWVRAGQFWGIPDWITEEAMRVRPDSMLARANPAVGAAAPKSEE